MRYFRIALFPAVALALVLAAAPAHAAPKVSIGYYWSELTTWFAAGGNSMWFILLCSILSVAFILERMIRLQRKRLVPRALAAQCRELWQQGRYDDIVALCDQDKSMLAKAIRALAAHRNIPVADIRTIVGDTIGSDLGLHFRRVHPIAVAATVAPLLGLFGTVTGMISAFNHFKLLGETGDPTVFAGDISLALITTEAGLLVAIPSLAAWHWFRNRTNAFRDELEGVVQELLVEWFVVPQGAPARLPQPAAVR